MIDTRLYEYMHEQLRMTPKEFTRYKYHEIDWASRLVGIVGPRGVGKSTMVLQWIINHPESHSLYVSADNLYFSSHTLVDLADDFIKEGGLRLFIDEVHKYPGWSRELKQIHDSHPSLKTVFTGSSVLDIKQGESDLSRRALVYDIQGLSFREFAELFHKVKSDVYSLDDLLEHRVEFPVEHPLPMFREYLTFGYYPFALENGFNIRINQVIDQTIEVDIPQFANMNASTARKLKQLLSVVAELAPCKPNGTNLATEIGVSKNNINDYLVYLEKAGMISLLLDDTSGLRKLGKVEKLYIDNPSLMNALAKDTPDTGAVRETFFYNQTRVRHNVVASRVSDFTIGKYTFEIGGKKKGKRQIEGIENGFIVRDDIETGHGIVVPLWHFGLLY